MAPTLRATCVSIVALIFPATTALDTRPPPPRVVVDPPPPTAAVDSRFLQHPVSTPTPAPESDHRTLLLEELIVGMAENRSLTELRSPIVALYPELAADLPSGPLHNRADSFRSAALHFRLRQELISAVLSEYLDRTALGLGSD